MDMNKTEPLCVAGRNVTTPTSMVITGESSRKRKVDVLYDPAVSLGIYLNDSNSAHHRDVCTLVLMAALFTMARPWYQSKCLRTEELVRKISFICTMELWSAIRIKLHHLWGNECNFR